MKQFALALLLLALFTGSAGAQDCLEWKEGRKIAWSDFTGRPDNTSEHWAYTRYYINYKYSYNNTGAITITVTSCFRKDQSWKKAEKELTAALLLHEQQHFDIGELYARKIRKAFASYTATHKHNANTTSELNALFEKLMTEAAGYQDQYDSETDHSKNRENQARWNSRVATELAALADYKAH
ncbi:MAG: DUF922 domain-containing protein [Flavipsychrobacter sp.]|nr:DUF922 domain-containing protein [Flavipsychrobacter sp.]